MAEECCMYGGIIDLLQYSTCGKYKIVVLRGIKWLIQQVIY